jgi:hypothetical protein
MMNTLSVRPQFGAYSQNVMDQLAQKAIEKQLEEEKKLPVIKRFAARLSRLESLQGQNKTDLKQQQELVSLLIQDVDSTRDHIEIEKIRIMAIETKYVIPDLLAIAIEERYEFHSRPPVMRNIIPAPSSPPTRPSTPTYDQREEDDRRSTYLYDKIHSMDCREAGYDALCAEFDEIQRRNPR